MRENVHKDVYRFAYDEASTELRKILKAFEQLCAQKNRVEKLMEVLKPELGMQELANDDNHVDTPALLHRGHPPNRSLTDFHFRPSFSPARPAGRAPRRVWLTYFFQARFSRASKSASPGF